MNIDSLQSVCIVGWGKSGVSLCTLLLSSGKRVRVTEQRQRSSFPAALIDRLRTQGVSFEFGGHSQSFIAASDLIVVSPGVDLVRSPLAEIARACNIPCVGELEFSFWLTPAKWVAITGTNGKTTTTFLTYRVLKEKKKRVFLGGNIGIPVSSLVLQARKGDFIVAEVSSFQLETIIEFRPKVAALLNLEPDHLDRYSDFSEYVKAKMNIFKNQTPDDWAVLPKELPLLKEARAAMRSQPVYFSSEFPNANLSCVYRMAAIFGLTRYECEKVFFSFRGLPHRLQKVGEINGVTFINDSKATNPASTVWALKNTKGSIVLIAGGKDKGVGYADVLPFLKRVKQVTVYGESSLQIQETIENKVPTQRYHTLEEAVAESFAVASSGDTILFSPMCSSFDMFSNYRERGKRFVAIVKDLASRGQKR